MNSHNLVCVIVPIRPDTVRQRPLGKQAFLETTEDSYGIRRQWRHGGPFGRLHSRKPLFVLVRERAVLVRASGGSVSKAGELLILKLHQRLLCITCLLSAALRQKHLMNSRPYRVVCASKALVPHSFHRTITTCWQPATFGQTRCTERTFYCLVHLPSSVIVSVCNCRRKSPFRIKKRLVASRCSMPSWPLTKTITEEGLRAVGCCKGVLSCLSVSKVEHHLHVWIQATQAIPRAGTCLHSAACDWASTRKPNTRLIPMAMRPGRSVLV